MTQLVQALRYKPERSRIRFPLMSLELFIHLFLPAALCPGVDSGVPEMLSGE